MSALVLAAITSVLAIAPYAPFTSGGWTTWLKPLRYSDLVVRGDTVWCATREAGLLRFKRSDQTFAAISRFPNGLASNELSALAYDRSGRLWIGTYGSGASRMSADGQSWTLINPFDGLPSDTVNCLEAEGDTMWIGTPRGIAFWNGSFIAGSLPVFGQPSPFASDNVTGVVVRGDTLWVATDAGIYTSLRSERLEDWTLRNSGLPPSPVGALVTNDTLLFARIGLSVYKFVNNTWQLQLGGGQVHRMFDDDGIVTAATSTGIWRLTNSGFAQLSSEAISGADEQFMWIPAPTGDGRYVAASRNGVLVQPAPGAVTGWPFYVPDTPPDNDLRNLNLDGAKVWVNSEDGGVGRLTGDTWRIWPASVTPCSGPCDTTFINPLFVKALLVDRYGKKWFGCWEYALEEMDDRVSPPHFIHHAPDDALGAAAHTRMWASAADSAGGRWFGSDTPELGVIEPIGLEYFADSAVTVGVAPDTSTAHFAVYRGSFRTANTSLRGNKIHGLTVDRLNRLWVGMTGQGIQTAPIPGSGFGPGVTPSFTLVPNTDRLDVQGLVARGDSIWALTTHELQRYDRRNPALFPATYTIPEATPLFAVNPLAVGPDGSPWVGTEAGMRRYLPGGGFQDFNIRNSPIAGDQIYAIRVHPVSGVVWISTSTGMSRYDPNYRPPPPVQVAQLRLTVYPNPVLLTRGGVELRLNGNASVYRGSIMDILGRRVGDFDVPANGRVIWDGKDEEGRMVKPGIYLVNVEAGGRAATVRVVVLR